ncbi:sugar 3,4-ketoisomerase [Echinicola shivajiensis]|uniref:sugar 3,4-ketoisomerase n=1 Tax=Echinicola shivajiensis TaxID=1035916 RepID=UPI001BFC4AA8|nr:FdtA/QdtA family cupin domain-containing protein [Echinicola shivajiensis]
MVEPYVFSLGAVKRDSGDLCFWSQEIFPFEVARSFWITGVPAGEKRGVHAHYSDEQITICLQGKVSVDLEDLEGVKYQFELDNPAEALYLPSLVWSSFTFDANSILLVFSSKPFSEADYIRNKVDFEKLQNGS